MELFMKTGVPDFFQIKYLNTQSNLCEFLPIQNSTKRKCSNGNKQQFCTTQVETKNSIYKHK